MHWLQPPAPWIATHPLPDPLAPHGTQAALEGSKTLLDSPLPQTFTNATEASDVLAQAPKALGGPAYDAVAVAKVQSTLPARFVYWRIVRLHSDQVWPVFIPPWVCPGSLGAAAARLFGLRRTQGRLSAPS